MERFQTNSFVKISGLLTQLGAAAAQLAKPDQEIPKQVMETLKGEFQRLSERCEEFRLRATAKSAQRLSRDIEGMSGSILQDRLGEFRGCMADELEDHLFFWIPPERAEYFEKAPEELLGSHCATRFVKSEILREMSEAMKCYAVARFTSCAFHLMRVSEAGVRALAAAIGYAAPNPNWGQVFREFDRQLTLPRAQRPSAWSTHSDFLEEIAANLRAVRSAWRNDTMHLENTYTEEDAAMLLRTIADFMKRLSERLDEDGTLY